jgi:hypothetical protein
LEELQDKWLSLFWSMMSDEGIDRRQLAAPFLSVAPDGYDPIADQTILYIGKATGGTWYREQFQQTTTPSDWRQKTQDCLKWMIEQGYPTPFWRFARTLNDLIGEHPVQPLRNIVWSNIAKIGVREGNPEGRYLSLQASLAEETLKAEIAHYSPSLVVFVSNDYAEDIVRSLFISLGACQDEPSWDRSLEDQWWRAPTGNLPAFICAKHPQFKSAALIQSWSDRAAALLNHSGPERSQRH